MESHSAAKGMHTFAVAAHFISDHLHRDIHSEATEIQCIHSRQTIHRHSNGLDPSHDLERMQCEVVKDAGEQQELRVVKNQV